MIVGALCAGVAVAFAIAATRDLSTVERRIDRMTRARRARSVRVMTEDGLELKVTGCLVGACVGCALAWAGVLNVIALPLAAGVGWLAGAIALDRRSAWQRSADGRAMVTLVEWLFALVASGRPVESAVDLIGSTSTGTATLDLALRRARRDYTLGVPLHDAIAREGAAIGIPRLADLGDRLRRARSLGRGMLPMLQDLRDQLRADERARALESASHIEGKLTLVLALCYLPALALLVMIPLFLTLLAGLFG